MARPASARRPALFHFALAISLAVLGALALWLALGRQANAVHGAGCWLLAVNLVTFGYYGYDKHQARTLASRVPEIVLHGLAVLGGSAGAFAGMGVFRHKTVKAGFRALFWLIVVVQAALALWIARLVWWS